MNAGMSTAGVAFSGGAVGVALRRTSRLVGESQPVLSGLVCAFLFVAQMVNFPIVTGTSGHLIGGALAGILLGPAMGILCLTVVVAVQVLFADGGLTALGLNLLNLAVVAVLGGFGIFRLGMVGTGRRPSRGRVGIAAGIAGFASVVLASLAFVVEYTLGGVVAVPATTLAAATTGIYALVGIAEGIVTAGVVASVVAARPDLVHGLQAAGSSESRRVNAGVAS